MHTGLKDLVFINATLSADQSLPQKHILLTGSSLCCLHRTRVQ